MIELRLRHRLGEIEISGELDVASRLLALCGPSGSGKTSVLNMIAGLRRPDEGRIVIGGQILLDTSKGVDLPARARRLGYVFQEPRLFPHMSVRANLVYGAQRTPRDGAFVSFDDIVALLGIAPLLARRPDRLSGGEKQRVAIGRALLSQPRALLLDEPLSAIDDARRQEILALVETLRDAFAIPTIFVSHRVDEVTRLAEDVAMIEAGKLRLRER